MFLNQEQVDELKQLSPNLSIAEEGGYTYIYLQNHPLPAGCNPAQMNLLLCPMHKNGYSSILYFENRLLTRVALNWNGTAHVLGKSWFSYSWQTPQGHTLFEMLQVHLKALIP